MVTDPIADLLTRLQNASRVRKERINVPSSKMTRAILTLLEREGYLNEVDTRSKAGALSVSLKYANGRPAIGGAKRVSKPSRRMYLGVRDIKPVKRGQGLLVLSTPAGVLTGLDAKKQRIGGEALFEIW